MVHYCSVHGKWTYILYIYTYVCVLSQQNFERMLTLERAPTFGKQAESLLGEKLISPTRRLIREGAAMKLSARTSELNERYLFLVCTPASNAYISRRQYSEHSRHATLVSKASKYSYCTVYNSRLYTQQQRPALPLRVLPQTKATPLSTVLCAGPDRPSLILPVLSIHTLRILSVSSHNLTLIMSYHSCIVIVCCAPLH